MNTNTSKKWRLTTTEHYQQAHFRFNGKITVRTVRESSDITSYKQMVLLLWNVFFLKHPRSLSGLISTQNLLCQQALMPLYLLTSVRLHVDAQLSGILSSIVLQIDLNAFKRSEENAKRRTQRLSRELPYTDWIFPPRRSQTNRSYMTRVDFTYAT